MNLVSLFNTVISTPEEAIPYAQELVKRGAQNVIVSLGENGAVFVNNEIVLYAHGLKGEVKSTVGSGDSMVAGFIAHFKKTKSLEEAFRFSVAAGSATAFSLGLCTRDKVENLVPQVRLRNDYRRGDGEYENYRFINKRHNNLSLKVHQKQMLSMSLSQY